MNRQETAKIISLITIAFPKYASTLDDDAKKQMLMLWQTMFAMDDYKAVESALQNCLNTSEFPPTIAEIRRRIDGLTLLGKNELWETLCTASVKSHGREFVPIGRNRLKEVSMKQSVFDELPKELQLYAVNPSGLQELRHEIYQDPVKARTRFDKRIDEIRTEMRYKAQKESMCELHESIPALKIKVISDGNS